MATCCNDFPSLLHAGEREKQIVPPSHHFHGQYFYQALLSTKRHTRNRSVMVKMYFDLGYGQVLPQNKINKREKQCYVEILT